MSGEECPRGGWTFATMLALMDEREKAELRRFSNLENQVRVNTDKLSTMGGKEQGKQQGFGNVVTILVVASSLFSLAMSAATLLYNTFHHG